ncbi:MAG: VacJ family lipoprotein [Proteobacteria bacterium]|nr:VacJ family lipoprotein [Pseudomonadota bacterium]
MSRARRLLPALVLAQLLAGCATSDFSARNEPPQTPAADNAAAVEHVQELVAASKAAPAPRIDEAALGPPLTAADVPSLMTYDPWERMNRFTYRFNARFDEAVFLPVANGYRRLPRPVQSGLHNFFSNLTEVVSTANYLLQLRPGPALRSLGRFALNSTLGIGGLLDVATEAHIPKARTGFGNTLARWGVHPGPYLVVPILGPYTLRDGFGFAADFGTAWAINFPPVYQGTIGWVLTPVAMVDTRANADFRYYGTGSVFEYDNVRFLYVRKTLIEDDAIRMWHRHTRPDPRAEAGQ